MLNIHLKILGEKKIQSKEGRKKETDLSVNKQPPKKPPEKANEIKNL